MKRREFVKVAATAAARAPAAVAHSAGPCARPHSHAADAVQERSQQPRIYQQCERTLPANRDWLAKRYREAIYMSATYPTSAFVRLPALAFASSRGLGAGLAALGPVAAALLRLRELGEALNRRWFKRPSG